MNESPSLRDASVQEIQLELLRRSCWNALDGERVHASLMKHRELWLAVLLDRPGVANYAEPSSLLMSGLIKLRDLPDNFWTLLLRFRGLQPGVCRNSFYGKHLYEVIRDAEIPPQLSATKGFRVTLANQPPETQDEPCSAAHNAVGLAGESPVMGIDCLPT